MRNEAASVRLAIDWERGTGKRSQRAESAPAYLLPRHLRLTRHFQRGVELAEHMRPLRLGVLHQLAHQPTKLLQHGAALGVEIRDGRRARGFSDGAAEL